MAGNLRVLLVGIFCLLSHQGAFSQEISSSPIGKPIVLWDGKETFGWTLPKGVSKKDKLGIGGIWEHNTLFGPGNIDVFFAAGPKASLTFYQTSVNGKNIGSTTYESEGSGGNWSHSWTGGVSRMGFKSNGAKVNRIEYRAKAMKSLFNGKDLSGWKVFPDKKSLFQWNPLGWLSVKNGQGDLQSEQIFGNFFTQVDVKTNGKHLNSGIFFRGIPDQYCLAYEAQIRNQFNETADQKYSVETFNPKTNKLEGKLEMNSKAVDFGTGAIYRRIPARVQASKDNEWFTLCIAAYDRHFSTWVNGIQVTDWTDNRPINDNPRLGYRSKPGAFSIQGHDPTTDIDFRNFRVKSLDE